MLLDNSLTPNLELLKKHLAEIARPRDCFADPVALRQVQGYIRETLRSFGYTTQNQTFELQGTRLENILAFKGCADASELADYFLIGAHFDGVPNTTAADDNASGVAGMLEVARLIQHLPIARKFCFVAFNAEEYGMIGSQHYVKEIKMGSLAKPMGMFSLEMIGYTSKEKGSQKIPAILKPFYPDTGDFIALIGDTNSRDLLRKTKTAFKSVGLGNGPATENSATSPLRTQTLTIPLRGHVLEKVRRSDHSPFWDIRVPSLLITDTSMFRNPHYHTPTDTLETLDLDFLCRVTEGVALFATTALTE